MQEIKKQTIKDEKIGSTFQADSCCEIEHLFYGNSITEDYFKTEMCPGGHKISFKSDGMKTKFAKEIVPLLDKKHFKLFEPMFEFIISECT